MTSLTTEELFQGLLSRNPAERDRAWQRLSSQTADQIMGMKCPLPKYKGWSGLAVAARSAMTGTWSRDRFSILLSRLRPEHLDHVSFEGIPDGTWVWVGCVREAHRNTSREPRLLHVRDDFEHKWGADKLLTAQLAMHHALPKLDKSTQAAFEAAWYKEWHHRWRQWYRKGPMNQPEHLSAWEKAFDAGSHPHTPPIRTLMSMVEDHPSFWSTHPPLLRKLLMGCRHESRNAHRPDLLAHQQERRAVRHWMYAQARPDHLLPEGVVETWEHHPQIQQALQTVNTRRALHQHLDKAPHPSASPEPRRLRL